MVKSELTSAFGLAVLLPSSRQARTNRGTNRGSVATKNCLKIGVHSKVQLRAWETLIRRKKIQMQPCLRETGNRTEGQRA
jgi:hypothetical protein